MGLEVDIAEAKGFAAAEAGPAEKQGVTAADIVSRIERLPYSTWHTWIIAVVGITIFFDSVDNIALAYVLPVLSGQWHMTPQEIGALISAAFIGGMVGAPACGWLAERYGRMRLMMVTIVLYTVMSLLCANAWNFGSLFIFRIIQGFGLGAEVPIAATFINEWSKTKRRGRFFLLYGSIYTAGALGGSLLGIWIVPNLGWQYMFYLGAVPAVFVIVLRFFVPESPRWLAGKGRLEEAHRIVCKVEDSISKGGKIQLPPIVPVTVTGPDKETRFTELFSGVYMRRTLVLWTLSFCIAFVLLGMSAWLPTIFRTVFKLPLQTALTYGMLSSLTVLISGLTAAFLIDWAGRRLWFSVCSFIGCIPWFVVWYIKPSSAEVLLVCILSSTLFFASTLNLTILYMTEIYPTRMRALGSSVSRVWYGLAAIVSPLTIGFIVQRFGFWPVPLLLACMMVTTGIVAAIFAVETNGRILEDIAP